MVRSSVPIEFAGDGPPRAHPNSVKYARDLLVKKDLFKDSRWFDRVNAMDSDEYDAYLQRVSNEMETWDQRKVSKTIEWLKALPWKPREEGPGREALVSAANRAAARVEVNRSQPAPEQVPTGRYAVEAESGELRFYRVWRGTRNPDYVSVHVQHGPDEDKLPWNAVPAILRKIADAGAYDASVRYGREIGSCGRCGTRLTNALSRELGIGPVCGGRFWAEDPGYWKATKAEARAAILARGEDPDSEV